MLFNSLAFLVFFSLVIPVFFVLPKSWRWVWLLFASCYFYMAFVPAYILILFALISVDYFMGRVIESATGWRKRLAFSFSLLANIGTLFVFKYFNFFNQNLTVLAHAIHWNYSLQALHLALPLGLSFHIFQSLSYIIEVQAGRQTVERHLGMYALYVLFFPQLVAGPIERPQHLLPQLHALGNFDVKRCWSGVCLMAWGFFKKVVIADRLTFVVDQVYAQSQVASGPMIVVALVFFSFQLYSDFSGYSDIAVGAARIFGIDLTRNFLRPYFSASIAEFWRRWHISLSQWFRDYVYFPLLYRGPWRSPWWLAFSIIVTFLLTGLWHGAGWTYVIMGAIHGTAIALGTLTKKWREKFAVMSGFASFPGLRRIWQTGFTFCLVSFSWIFFRASSVSDAMRLIARLPHPGAWLIPGYSVPEFGLSLCGIFVLLAVEAWQERQLVGEWFSRQPLLIRSFAFSTLVLIIMVYGVYHSKQFIYFQF